MLTDLPVLLADSVSVTLQTTRADEGEVIVREGGPADKFFIVVEGEVEVVREGGQSETLGPGEFFGEMAIMRDMPRAATVRATKATTLLSMDRDTFRDAGREIAWHDGGLRPADPGAARAAGVIAPPWRRMWQTLR